ncbi:DUF922 domain-containing protein [Pontimicrobium aquaticum]|uniref:DUF922 domain-containing protein n=1 Tax=Pontimicrobium aquaticum TaxID=2565367 RepID=A0A4U0EWL3_9FLAO|nr:DUF922 domain-containing protein [Pontimicrobium aquaticum]TJY36315.1 DUF922 domain-containing protein [Pontimicrobium aquaticum]
MYKFLIASALSILLFQDSPVISWDLNNRLEWSNFKGKPKPENNSVAVTASGITFSYSTKMSDTRLIDYNYTVSADFYPDKSWCLKEKVNNNILNHERLHFDITELHARMFRQRIENTRFTKDIEKQMNRLHNAINKELEALQNKYDAETRHSQNIEKQQEWQEKIVDALNKLVRYSS